MPPSHRRPLCRCSSCPSPVSVQINISLLHLQNHQNFPHSAVFEHEDTYSGAGQGQRRYLEDRSCHCAIGDRTAAAVGLRSPRPGRLRWPWSHLAPFSARPRASTPYAPYLLVIVWLLNERALSQTRFQAGLSKVAEDAFLDLVRADAARIARIRYPGVIRVIQTLNESKNVIAMVTEPIYASVGNALGQADNISLVPKELKGMLVKQAMVPRVPGLVLKTTVASVTVNALHCLGDLVSTLDKPAVFDIMHTSTMYCCGPLSTNSYVHTWSANSIYKQYVIEFAAEHVLPLLFPLLPA